MDLGTFIGVLWRRRVLTLLALVLAVGSGVAYAVHTGPSYSYSSTVLLLPPDTARKQAEGHVDYTAGNPLFYLGSLEQARDILVSSMSSNDTQEVLLRQFPGATFTVSGDALSSSPVVVVSTTSKDRTAAGGLVRAVTARVPGVLAGIQTQLRIDAGSRITSDVLVTDTRPAVSHKGQIRRAIMATGGLGLVLLFLIGALDAWLRGRGRREPVAAPTGIGLVREEDEDEDVPALKAAGGGRRTAPEAAVRMKRT